MKETLKEKILRVTSEKIEMSDYNPIWEKMFKEEKEHLQKHLPQYIIIRIEHFGSTAIPNMPAKPIIDILVEVVSLEETKLLVVPILESQGYEYFWGPSFDEDKPPYYCWFIKRDKNGKRTHHIHMVEKNSELWDRLYFRDYIIENPNIAKDYAELKLRESKKYNKDRISYTKAKSEFISKITVEAKNYF